MGDRHRVDIGMSYRPARLHSLAELVPWNRFLLFKSLKIRALATILYLAWFDEGGPGVREAGGGGEA